MPKGGEVAGRLTGCVNMNRSIGLALLGVLSACSAGGAGAEAATSVESAEATSSTVIEDYPDAIVRDLWRQMAAPRPVPNSALPPRHLDVERFPELLVERYLIVSGGLGCSILPVRLGSPPEITVVELG